MAAPDAPLPASPSDEVPTSARLSWIYRISAGVAIVGFTAGTFCSTVITTEYGGVAYGAMVTALWLILMIVGRLLVAPYLPLVVRKFGSRTTFLSVKIAATVLWILIGLGFVTGVLSVPVLYATGPIFGALTVFASTLSTLYTAAYVTGHQMSGALARMAIVRGGAVAVGALLAATIALTIGPAWGLVARGVFDIPFIFVILLTRPGREPEAPRANREVWRSLRADISSNPGLRRLIVLGMGLTIFAMPLTELIVPITASLRPDGMVPGAALLVAAASLGGSLSILPINALQYRYAPGQAAAIMGASRGLALVLFGLSAYLLTGAWELAVWAVIGLGFGMSRSASGALMASAAVATVARQDSSRALVAFSFSCTLMSPVGLILWSVLIDLVSVEAAVAVGAVGALAVSWWVFRRSAGDPIMPRPTPA